MAHRGRRAAAPGHFAALPGFRLHLLARLSERYAELLYWRKFALRMPEVRVIGILGDRSRLSFGRVCREVELDKSQASRLVGRLMKRALLSRSSDPDDSRSVLLSLTARGRRLHARLYREAHQRNHRLFGVLGVTHSAALLEAIEILLRRARALWSEERARAGRRSVRTVDEPVVLAAGAAYALPRSIVLDGDLASQLYRLIGAALGRPSP